MAVVLLSGHLLNEALLLPHDYPILLTASVLAQCPVAGFPGNWWANLTSIPSINGSLLLPEKLRWLLGTMRCCSRTLLWTIRLPCAPNCWYRCCCFGACSLVLRLGNSRLAGLRGAAKQLPSQPRQRKLPWMQRYQGMWVGNAKFWGNPEVAIHEQCGTLWPLTTMRDACFIFPPMGEMLIYRISYVIPRYSISMLYQDIIII